MKHAALFVAILVALFACFTCNSVTGKQLTAIPAEEPRLVLFDHDGGVDDFITLLLLLARPQQVKLIGITILEGDCHAHIAANTTVKLLQLLGQPEVPVAVSNLPAVNPFPAAYRSQGLILDVLPTLNQQQPSHAAADKLPQVLQQPGQDVFAQLLQQQQHKVTVIATGPLSNLAYALSNYPQVADKIEHVWWMGGALRVRGNVYQPHTDGSAEWNAYWDPAALGVVWGSSVPLTLVPLDGTNKVPITPALVYSFGPQAHFLYSQLAGTMYAPVVNWALLTPGDPYYAWDALTAACMLEPALCKVEHNLQVAAVLSGPAQGATVLVGQQEGSPPTPVADVQQQQQQSRSPEHRAHGDSQSTPHIERVLLGTQEVPTGSGGVGDAAAAAGVQGSVAGSSGAVYSMQGSEVSQQLSPVKAVSAVIDVDAQQFHQLLLQSFRQ